MLQHDLLITVLRVLIGALFVGHGAQKLFGWFGGAGMNASSQWMAGLGLRPARLWATIGALGEFGGGLMFALGLLTPVASALLVASMLVAIFLANGAKGLWNTQGGYEYNLVLLASAYVIGGLGPNQYTLDQWIAWPWAYATLFAVSMVVAIAGAVIAIVTARTQQQPSETKRDRLTT